MDDLDNMLDGLGLSQYAAAFRNEGFDTWSTITDITENDLDALGVKLGHRRKLQRAIAETRDPDRPQLSHLHLVSQSSPPVKSHSHSDDANSLHQEPSGSTKRPCAPKRKYRRHPKPDEHAPERPPSAYVIFSHQVRGDHKGQDLSFSDMAKLVGEKWQQLSPKDKEPCEEQARILKTRYYSDLAEYKRTANYELYQAYFAHFKASDGRQGRQDLKQSRNGMSRRSSNASSGSCNEDITETASAVMRQRPIDRQSIDSLVPPRHQPPMPMVSSFRPAIASARPFGDTTTAPPSTISRTAIVFGDTATFNGIALPSLSPGATFRHVDTAVGTPARPYLPAPHTSSIMDLLSDRAPSTMNSNSPPATGPSEPPSLARGDTFSTSSPYTALPSPASDLVKLPAVGNLVSPSSRKLPLPNCFAALPTPESLPNTSPTPKNVAREEMDDLNVQLPILETRPTQSALGRADASSKRPRSPSAEKPCTYGMLEQMYKRREIERKMSMGSPREDEVNGVRNVTPR